MSATETVVATVVALYAPFSGGPKTAPRVETIAAETMPQPYRQLLVHKRHMTAAMEKFHGRPVALRVLEEKLEATAYTRKILLLSEGTNRVVQFGIVRISQQLCGKRMWEEILAGEKPLGRILAEQKVLRRVEPWAYLRVSPNEELMELFSLGQPEPLYGRLATIFCEGRKAIEVLEVSTPEKAGQTANPR